MAATGNADKETTFPYVAPKTIAKGRSIKLLKNNWELSLFNASNIGPLICNPPTPKNNTESIKALNCLFDVLLKLLYTKKQKKGEGGL